MQARSAGSRPEPPARRSLVLAAVSGFVVGSGVLGVLWLLSGSASGPAEDAKAACAALARAGDLPVGRPAAGRSDLRPGTVQHVAAARELSAAAAESSGVYRDLADHVEGVSRMVISLNFGDPAGRWHLEKAVELCARV